MIIWNIDPSNYTISQLKDLLDVVEGMDSSIAKEISEHIEAVDDPNMFMDVKLFNTLDEPQLGEGTVLIDRNRKPNVGEYYLSLQLDESYECAFLMEHEIDEDDDQMDDCYPIIKASSSCNMKGVELI